MFLIPEKSQREEEEESYEQLDDGIDEGIT